MNGHEKVSFYCSKIEKITEEEIVQKIYVKFELQKLLLMTNLNETEKDLGDRLKIYAKIEMELISRKGNIILNNLRFSAPLQIVNNWMNTNFTESEVSAKFCKA